VKETIKSLLKAVGLGLVSAHPSGRLALTAINAFLPGDKKLKLGATGAEAVAAIEQLSSEDQTKVYTAELELEASLDKGWTERFTAMTSTGGDWGWVRPFIVLEMSQLIFLGVGYIFMVVNDIVYKTPSTDMLTALTGASQLWVLVAAALSVPTTIVLSWFGHREKGKQRKDEILNNQPVTPITGLITSLLRK